MSELEKNLKPLSSIRYSSYLLALGFLLLDTQGFAQSQSNLFEVPDSLKLVDTIRAFYWGSDSTKEIKDSADIVGQLHYRPHLKQTIAGRDLGNNGSAARNSLFEVDRSSGFRLNYNALSSWRWQFYNLPYFKSNSAYTHLLASQGNSFANSTGSSQDNSHFQGTFSKGFAHQVHTTVFYRKISEDGLLLRDESNHTQLAVRIDQSAENNRWTYSVAYIRNVFNRHENGGVVDLTNYENDQFTIRRTIPVHLNDANSRDEENLGVFALKYSLISSEGYNGLFIENITSYNRRTFKYADDQVEDIDSIYQKWVNHSTGMRHAWQLSKLNNDISVGWSSRLFPDIRTGLKYTNSSFDNEASSFSQDFATLHGGLYTNVRDIVDLRAQSHIELLQDVGDFDLTGSLGLTWKKVGRLEGKIQLGLQTASLDQRHLAFNREEIQSFSLNPTQYLYIGGSLQIPKLKIQIKAGQHVLNDLVYLSEALDFQNASEVVAVTQLQLTSDLKLRGFHFKNILLWQSVDDAILTFPDWSSRHFIYFDGKVFKKKMSLRSGAEIRLHHQETSVQYVPMLNRFAPTSLEEGWSYAVDPFVEARIQRFIIFLKAENIESTWLQKPFLNARGYASNDWIFRFGVNWRYAN